MNIHNADLIVRLFAENFIAQFNFQSNISRELERDN